MKFRLGLDVDCVDRDEFEWIVEMVKLGYIHTLESFEYEVFDLPPIPQENS